MEISIKISRKNKINSTVVVGSLYKILIENLKINKRDNLLYSEINNEKEIKDISLITSDDLFDEEICLDGLPILSSKFSNQFLNLLKFSSTKSDNTLTTNNNKNNNIFTSTDSVSASILSFFLQNFSCLHLLRNLEVVSLTNWSQSLQNHFSLKNTITETFLISLNCLLQKQQFIAGNLPSICDILMWNLLNKHLTIDISSNIHLSRWYKYTNFQMKRIIQTASSSFIQNSKVINNNTATVNTQLKNNKNANKEKQKETKVTSYEGKLEGATIGNVITRFPPEPSGYLHIGHAKAALLNNYYAKLYNGKMILRFDDTNPAKEKIEFENEILYDLNLLNIKPDQITHTSDYFDYLMDCCEKLIKNGKAYADNTSVEIMRHERGEGIESVNRNNTIEQNLINWNKMKNGSDDGLEYCIRAKIDMQDNNKCMRDPVLYRCIVDIPHHIYNFKYKTYPTYDFACPLIDNYEKVSHAMRTNEYADRIPQYQWILSAFDFPQVIIYEFSKLNFVKTVLSKRKLNYFVENNFVDGWDDPRFPTVRGVTRRGLQVDALLQFILQQGPSKAANLMEWDKLWTINKQIIDPIVPRYMAVSQENVVVVFTNWPQLPANKTRPLHPKNEQLGNVEIHFFESIFIEIEDANELQIDEEFTLMKWGNAIVEKIEKNENKITKIYAKLHIEGDFKKTRLKAHWLPTSSQYYLNCILREFDHLLLTDKILKEEDWLKSINPNTIFDTLSYGDILLKNIKIGDIVQFERRGYFKFDKIDDKDNYIFIKIPDGKSKAASRISTKVDAAQLVGKSKK